jgi:hypothetical protein
MTGPLVSPWLEEQATRFLLSVQLQPNAHELNKKLLVSLLMVAVSEGVVVGTTQTLERDETALSRAGRMTPIRVQLSRKKGWRMPPNTVKVCRPGEFSNFHRVSRITTKRWCVQTDAQMWFFDTRAMAHKSAVDLYRLWAMTPGNDRLRQRIRLALKGRNLACWCPLDLACHADVLLELANA